MYQRVLGVLWDTTTDCFKFGLNLRKRQFTRRGLLLELSSVFDFLGFVKPLILTARLLFQDLCRRKYGWDDALLEEDVWIQRQWLDNLNNLSTIAVRSCILPPDVDLATLSNCERHHFADESSVEYSTVTYSIVAENGATFCSFMMGKSHLAPLKSISIPRLELVAATMPTKADTLWSSVSQPGFRGTQGFRRRSLRVPREK